jgi:DNA repair ATPase RecN
MNKIKKNRSLLFLIATMVIGVVLVGVLMFAENSDIKSDEIIDNPPPVPLKELENKIDNLKNQNFDPTCYNTLSIEIDASFQSGLITNTVKNNLQSNLATVYSNLVYNQCEFYLTGNRINTSTNILKWLQQLETITSRNSKIDYYRSQINAYDYYSEQFINKVNSFCNTTEFDENVYSQLKTEANTMPRLNNKYKNNTKFNQIKQQSVAKLEIAYRRWAEQDSEL